MRYLLCLDLQQPLHCSSFKFVSILRWGHRKVKLNSTDPTSPGSPAWPYNLPKRHSCSHRYKDFETLSGLTSRLNQINMSLLSCPKTKTHGSSLTSRLAVNLLQPHRNYPRLSRRCFFSAHTSEITSDNSCHIDACSPTENLYDNILLPPIDSAFNVNETQELDIPPEYRNCDNPQTLLDLIVERLNQDLFHCLYIPSVVGHYQNLVYSQLPLAYSLAEPRLCKQQIVCSPESTALISQFNTDPRWLELLSFIERHTTDISIEAQSQLVYHLSLMGISRNSELYEICLQNCLTSIHTLGLDSLWNLAHAVCDERDFLTQGKIAMAICNSLSDPEQDSSMSEKDLILACDALTAVHHVVGSNAFQLVISSARTMLEKGPTSLSVNLFLRLHQLAGVCDDCTYLERLPLDVHDSDLNVALRLKSGDNCIVPTQRVCEDIPLLARSSNKLSWPLSQVVKKLSSSSLNNLEKFWSLNDENFADPNQVAMILPHAMYCLPKLPHSFLVCIVSKADIWILLQMIDQHMKTDVTDHALRAYNDRLIEITKDMNAWQLREIVASSQGHFSHVLFNFLKLASARNIGASRRPTSKLLTSTLLPFSCCDTPPLLARFLLQRAAYYFNKDKQLNPRDLVNMTSLVCRLDLGASLLVYEQLDCLMLSRNVSASTKSQAQKLRAQIQGQFCQRLKDMSELPSSLATIHEGHSSTRYIGRPGLYEVLIKSFGKFIAKDSTRVDNSLKALKVLDATTEVWPILQESLLEDLTDVIMKNCPTSVSPALHLLKTLASTGYIPQDSEVFMEWLTEFVFDFLMRHNVDKSSVVQLSSYLSDMGIFYDDLICHVFNLDFITSLHRELADESLAFRRKLSKRLVRLSRSVAIECPHLAVACLHENTGSNAVKPYKTSRQNFYNIQRLVSSLRRICNSDDCVATSLISPYGHHIDGQITLDSSLVPTPVSDTFEKDTSDGYERIAFLYLDEFAFCVGDSHHHMTGFTQTKVRQLQMLEYTVIVVPHFELSSMEVSRDEALDHLIREKINTAIGMPVFSGIEQA